MGALLGYRNCLKCHGEVELKTSDGEDGFEGWDFVAFCQNAGCENSKGEPYFQSVPEWVTDGTD